MAGRLPLVDALTAAATVAFLAGALLGAALATGEAGRLAGAVGGSSLPRGGGWRALDVRRDGSRVFTVTGQYGFFLHRVLHLHAEEAAHDVGTN